jgi:hypothetical protein
VRELALIAAGYEMIINLEEKLETARTCAPNSGSTWFGDERRKFPRAEVDGAAYVYSGGAITRCLVLNISAEGAAIDVPNAAYIPDRFQLMTENDRVVRNCRVIWIQRHRIGVAFEKESDL